MVYRFIDCRMKNTLFYMDFELRNKQLLDVETQIKLRGTRESFL